MWLSNKLKKIVMIIILPKMNCLQFLFIHSLYLLKILKHNQSLGIRPSFYQRYFEPNVDVYIFILKLSFYRNSKAGANFSSFFVQKLFSYENFSWRTLHKTILMVGKRFVVFHLRKMWKSLKHTNEHFSYRIGLADFKHSISCLIMIFFLVLERGC